MTIAPRLLLVLALAACLPGCGEYPRDPDGTLARVRGGVMQVGVIHDPPFVVVGAGQPGGPEVALVQRHANALGARIQWHHAGAGRLMRELQARRLDAVVGGHVADSPWAGSVAMSRPYRVRDAQGHLVTRALALPPGENAWQMAVERHAAAPASRALLERPVR